MISALEPIDELTQRVASHIGAAVSVEGRMLCPACDGDFGPTIPVESLSVYELGYLPGAPLLAGVCLDCGHVVEPKATTISDEDEDEGGERP